MFFNFGLDIFYAGLQSIVFWYIKRDNNHIMMWSQNPIIMRDLIQSAFSISLSVNRAYLLIEALRTGVVGQCAKDIDIHYSTCFKRIAYCFSSEVPSTTDPANCFRVRLRF